MARGPVKRLNALAIAAATGERNIHDGDGLYLRVRKDSSKSWGFRYMLAGKPHWLSLGPLRDVTLAEAREKARMLRNRIRDGYDPLADRRMRKAEIIGQIGRTFDAVADQYIAAHAGEWKNAKHAAQWTATIRAYASPMIGRMPVDAIGLDEVLRVLQPIWETKSETASRLRGRIESVLDFGAVHKWRTGENPARWTGFLDQVLPAKGAIAPAVPHPSLPYSEVASFLVALRQKDTISARCLEWKILTACRSGEARGARWSEIDAEKKLWILPASRMKARREHIVPLSGRCLEILAELAAQPHQPDGLIFPGQIAGKPMSDVSLAKAMRSIVKGYTPHGCRATFRTWVQEATSFPSELGELCLAHTNKNKVEAAYARGPALEKRRHLMEAWAQFCAGVPVNHSAEVVPMRRA
ncbi:MAG: integrase arm-type DNA-binding domain-containing protein [Acidiphilium sp.]|jgi:integrase|nr:integrase arm-type DNA-binding domain-containing protein [Acidiphilium sp.]